MKILGFYGKFMWLTAVGPAGGAHLRIECHNACFLAGCRLGHPAGSEAALRRQLALARELGDQDTEMIALVNLAISLYSRGQEREAIDFTEQAAEAARKASVPRVDYTVRIEKPVLLAAGRDVRVVLRIANAQGATPALEEIAGSVVHLVIVNRSLSVYRHVHPRPEDGAFTAVVRFPSNGEYVVHAMFQPVDRSEQVHKEIWSVGKTARNAAQPAL